MFDDDLELQGALLASLATLHPTERKCAAEVLAVRSDDPIVRAVATEIASRPTASTMVRVGLLAIEQATITPSPRTQETSVGRDRGTPSRRDGDPGATYVISKLDAAVMLEDQGIARKEVRAIIREAWSKLSRHGRKQVRKHLQRYPWAYADSLPAYAPVERVGTRIVAPVERPIQRATVVAIPVDDKPLGQIPVVTATLRSVERPAGVSGRKLGPLAECAACGTLTRTNTATGCAACE